MFKKIYSLLNFILTHKKCFLVCLHSMNEVTHPFRSRTLSGYAFCTHPFRSRTLSGYAFCTQAKLFTGNCFSFNDIAFCRPTAIISRRALNVWQTACRKWIRTICRTIRQYSEPDEVNAWGLKLLKSMAGCSLSIRNRCIRQFR